jgi:hypothetical protein
MKNIWRFMTMIGRMIAATETLGLLGGADSGAGQPSEI